MLLAELVLTLSVTAAAPAPSVDSPLALTTAEAVVTLSDDEHGKKKRRRRWFNKFKSYKKSKKTDGGSRPVPEPMTLSLLGLGGAGLALSARRRRKNAGADVAA